MKGHGLTEKQLQSIKAILKDFSHSIDSVHLFGSRAKGTYKNSSDIDLVVYGKLDEKMLDRLWTLFGESSLPYKVDINAYHLISHPLLKEHIDRFGKLLFSKKELMDHLC